MSTQNTSEVPVAKVTLLLIAGLLTFGFAPILVRFATDVEPLLLAAMRTGFSVLILLPFWLPKRKKLYQLAENGVSSRLMMAAGFCLGMHFTLWIASLHYTSVASASVLVTMHPVMLIIAESLIFKKNFRPLVWVGVLIAFGGSVLLGLADDAQMEQFPNALLGNMLAFFSAVIFVFYFLLGRKIRQKAEWIDYVYYVYLYASITCGVLVLIWSGGLPYVSFSAILVGIALAAGPTVLGHGSMNYAVKYISPTLLSTLILSEAVIAAIAAWLIFGEIPSSLSIGAMLVIVTGVSMSWTRRIQTRKKSG
ncbi:MAG: DMT family transporter [Balneolaceae bacterium]|nr:DMT family transporter [Balneolaceae bacterium]